MEVVRIRRSSVSSPIMFDRTKLATTPPRNIDEKPHTQQPQPQQVKNKTMKMFNKVQVVYYLTRNGQLEHPHFMEVSHLSTQPLRLKDVMDRLIVLRGKAMPCQYSWSCKRSYKNGYVWNDLTENDAIYACDGSEYVLKGSEIIHHHSDFCEVGRLEELQIRKQKIGGHMKTNGLVMTNKSNGTPQGHNYRQVSTCRHNKQDDAVKNYEHTDNNNDDDNDEDEEKGSCNSSNAPYSAMQMEQEESFSFPSTSSTNSDKQPPPLPPPVSAESKRHEKDASRVIQEDGDTTMSTILTRNSTNLLHLIACGGAGIVGPNYKSKGKGKGSNNNGSNSNRRLNLKMKNNFMPCLKQQLSSRGAATTTTADMIPPRISKEKRHDVHVDDHHQVAVNNEDEDMMMVRYMSENPRFGNLQSEEKEYFSGTIIEAMATNNQYHDHTQASAFTQPPVLTKSSSYNEHTRSSKGGLHAEALASKVEDDDEKDEDVKVKVKGMIKLCIPRKKSLSSLSTSTNSKHTCY